MTPSLTTLPAPIRTDLLAAAGLITVSPEEVHMAGVPVRRFSASPHSRSTLLMHLSDAFYSHWFARASAERREPAVADDRNVVAAVRAAHASTDRFENGWTVRAVDRNGRIVATKARDDLHLGPLDYANLTRRGAPVRPGDALAVTCRRDHVDSASGWWTTWRDAGTVSTGSIVRVYWNCGAGVVAQLVRGATTWLESRAIPYMMKCPADRSSFGRVDPVVMYLSPDGWAASKAGLREVHSGIAEHLRPEVPPLTLRLGRGVSLAEDPTDGRSFGQSRSQAIAAGALRAFDLGLVSVDDIVDSLAFGLHAHGIDPVRPYLRPGSPADALSTW